MNVFDMLEKAGYEAQNIGSGLLPATLMHDGTPVGFLMPDLSLSLVTEHTQEREALEPLMQYCVINAQAADYAKSTLNDVRVVFHQAYKAAVRNQLCETNPVGKLPFPNPRQ